MTLSEFVESKTYKNVMKYVYGWGAAVVLMGALFKIQHWPGAGPMLIAGMGTEVLIFFLSAFEPLHEEPDWTLVYPELAGMSNDLDDEMSHDYHPRRDSRLFDVSQLPPPVYNAGQSVGEGASARQAVEAPVHSSIGGGNMGGAQGFALQRFDQLLEQAELGPDLFVKMGQGIEKLAATAEGLNQMQDIVQTTNGFSTNMKSASEAAMHLSETYTSSNDVIKNATSTLSEASIKAADSIEKSGTNISETTQRSAESLINAATEAGKHLVDTVKGSGDILSSSYQQLIGELDAGLQGLKSGTHTYSEQIELQNKHLTALNSIYELQMRNMNQQNENTDKIFEKASETIKNMGEAVDGTIKYRDELGKLNDNLVSLNSIYGNMLSTFNLKND